MLIMLSTLSNRYVNRGTVMRWGLGEELTRSHLMTEGSTR
jgi:hypothetical protein